MADEKKSTSDNAKDGKKTKWPKLSLVTILILAGIIVAGAVGGFAVAHLLGSGPQSAAADTSKGPQNEDPANLSLSKPVDELLAASLDGKKVWYYDLDPVIANLDEPGVTRYLRAGITLEMSKAIDEIKGKTYLEEKKLLLRDWLTTYFAGLSLEDVRGTKSLARIKNQIRDQFNELLFPETKPMIHGIFLKEFAVQ